MRLDNNALTALPTELGALTGLTLLDLSFNQLTGVPADFRRPVVLRFVRQPGTQLGAGWRWRRNAGSPVPVELPLHGVGPAPVRPPAAPPLPRRPPGVALWRGERVLHRRGEMARPMS